MKKIKVVDFDSGCGGFTSGLENTGYYETCMNFKLDKKNEKCYNLVHKNKFKINDLQTVNDFDLLTYSFDLGSFLLNKGVRNFRENDVYNFLAFVMVNKPEHIIGITKNEAIFPLNSEKKVEFLYNGLPTTDIISCNLIRLGYNTIQYVFDGAGFGLPQHVFYNVYFATKNKPIIDLKERFGPYKVPYKVPGDYLKDVTDDSNLTWHDVNYDKKDVCQYIIQGLNARKTKEVTQNQGYKRVVWDKIMDIKLDSKFYGVSSDSYCIHPLYDRPLTIREGARLYGLHNGYDWDSSVSKKDVATMICNSFYPKLAGLIGQKIKSQIQK